MLKICFLSCTGTAIIDGIKHWSLVDRECLEGVVLIVLLQHFHSDLFSMVLWICDRSARSRTVLSVSFVAMLLTEDFFFAFGSISPFCL